MPTRQSIAAAFEAFARLLSTARYAALLMLRRGGLAAPQSARRSSPQAKVAPTRRGQEGNVAVSRPAMTSSLKSDAAHALRGDFRVIPISAISPAATPTRLVHEGIDRLAASIAGGSGREGLGLLAPVLVRLLDDERYELIDGARRLEACRMLAKGAGTEDALIPAIVFSVSARVAQQMRVAVLDVPEPTPIELARTYRALCDAMTEAGDPACTARGLTQVSHHGKTQIAGYLRIADAISNQVIVAAGLVTSAGHPAPEALVELTNSQLLDAAKGESVEARAASLKAHHDRLRGRVTTSSRQVTDAAESPMRHGDAVASTGRRRLSLMAKTRTMPPSEARALIENEVAPAMIALVEQAHGGRDAEGYYSEFASGHACLVVPRQVEGLTLEQLDRLDHALAMLSARTRRARDERVLVEALFPPQGEGKTS